MVSPPKKFAQRASECGARPCMVASYRSVGISCLLYLHAEMFMKLVLLVIKIALILQVKALTYYIVPSDGTVTDNGSCTVNGITLGPCHQLSQLNRTSLSNANSVTILFLPGTHIVPEHTTFTCYNVGEFEIIPFNTSQEVRVHCQMQAMFLFEDVRKVRITSLKFISCTLKMLEIFQPIDGNYDIIVTATSNYTVEISDCAFTDNSHDYSIILENLGYVLIEHCSFTVGNGAISCVQKSTPKTRLIISDTTLQGNWKRVNGGALYIETVALEFNSSTIKQCQGVQFIPHHRLYRQRTLSSKTISQRDMGALFIVTFQQWKCTIVILRTIQ